MNRSENIFKPMAWLMTLLLAAFVAGCGNSGGGGGGSSGGGGSVVAVAQAQSARERIAYPSVQPATLERAAGYAILAKSGVSTVPSSIVTGNVGLSPAARPFLTNWSETSDISDTFSTSAQVAPFKLYADDYAGGTTKTNLGTAVLSMQGAYTAAQAKPAGPCPGAGSFDGSTVPPLTPGVYTCAVNVTIPTNFTLNGPATGVWVFQITGTLTQASRCRCS